MPADRITANLPSRDFAATLAFYARLGFQERYRGDSWMILARGPLEVEFFRHTGLDPYASDHSACVRVDDLDGLRALWSLVGLPEVTEGIPRLTPVWKEPGVPQMFAVLDPDGSLLRVIDNGDR